MYKINPEYKSAVEKNPLYGLPMFEPEKFGLDPLPKVINDAVEVKAEVFETLEKNLTKQLWQVYLGFKKIGPCTDWQLSKYLGIERTSVNARRDTLVKYGLVERFDEIISEHSGKKNARWKVIIKVPESL